MGLMYAALSLKDVAIRTELAEFREGDMMTSNAPSDPLLC